VINESPQFADHSLYRIKIFLNTVLFIEILSKVEQFSVAADSWVP